MKNISILLLVILSIFLLTTCEEEIEENHINTIEEPKNIYIDTPIKTYKRRVETLNIANTIQTPVDTYLNSRVDVRASARGSVKSANKKMEEQDKAIEALLK